MASTANRSKTRPESTDIERRVLAHERVLQSRIAYIAPAEPGFSNHLREIFVERVSISKHEHDHPRTDDYAAEFIHAVMLPGEVSTSKSKESAVTDKQPSPPRGKEENGVSIDRPARRGEVQVRERSGIREVRFDGKFRGGYHQKEKEYALAAADLLRLPAP